MFENLVLVLDDIKVVGVEAATEFKETKLEEGLHG